jgi:hypothetical protein
MKCLRSHLLRQMQWEMFSGKGSSERPFGAVDAVTSVREYDTTDGHLVRVFSSNGKAEFRKPRGLRFTPNGLLYCVARDEVVGFDFASGECLGLSHECRG